MSRALSLRTWLALGLVVAIAAPAAAGAAAWLAAGAWQASRVDARRSAAMRLIDAARLDSAGGRKALAAGLARLGVEAQIAADPKFGDPSALKTAETSFPADQKAKQRSVEVDKAPVVTPGLDALLQSPGGKLDINHEYATTRVALAGARVNLFVRRESAPLRWAIALGAAVAALAAALVLAVSLLRRWVLRPLASLAADADRIAGGELELRPVATRASEVAQVSDALHGMAGGLRAALGASAAAERDRRFLVTAIAHDLRTPLFTLRGSLEAIEHGIDDGDALSRAQAKAAHLDRLVGDLFAFSRAEYARDGGAFESVDLSAIARRAAETVEPGAIRLDVRTNGPVAVNGDPVALQRVLTNLLDNALRHAHTRVELSVLAGRVEVADDGAGFAAADLPHVFEPLFRGDRARATGGAGLGLAIARRLVRAHGGEVEAANGPAGGARVHVTLPLS
jgi:signal transduction histidine kinase